MYKQWIGRVIYTDKERARINWEDRLACSVLNAWKDVSLDLVKTFPKTEFEICRQPLIWNSWLTDQRGQMLGSHTRCAWVELDRGPTQSIGA